MAKPIRATPTLRGKEAKKFLELMAKRERSPLSDTEVAGERKANIFVVDKPRAIYGRTYFS
ncbi:hypothetical protein HYX14_04325 [Candidatus Woesearchaeota archaeon]|nr:hypothetical protein [Candidatus Woesearchaeota archaeon]